MAANLAKWPSNRGLISKITPSDGCKGNTVPSTVVRGYDLRKPGGHLGNVGYELSLPFGGDLNGRIGYAKSATRRTVVLRSLTSQDRRELDARAGLAPREFARPRDRGIGYQHRLRSPFPAKHREHAAGTVIAMALISLILVLVFKSMRIGLVSLVPNFIPAAMSFGLRDYLVGRVALSASVGTAMAFGIVVDDTIHFLTKYLKARREGHPAPEAVRCALRTVGHALWITTAVFSLGFLVFASSGFEVSWALGFWSRSR